MRLSGRINKLEQAHGVASAIKPCPECGHARDGRQLIFRLEFDDRG
jgi:hypothetical protein